MKRERKKEVMRERKEQIEVIELKKNMRQSFYEIRKIKRNKEMRKKK